MYRMPIILLFAVLLAASPMAQEAEPETDTTEASESADDAPAAEEESSPLDDVTDEEIEELLGLDEDYDEADDGFDPTIEVRVKDAIVFPVDI